jgi:hypothetical protein
MRDGRSASLPHNGDENNIARIFNNVVTRFLINLTAEPPVDTLPADFGVVMIPCTYDDLDALYLLGFQTTLDHAPGALPYQIISGLVLLRKTTQDRVWKYAIVTNSRL